MADIKRTFTKGKMNKDLNERLLPSGEYRDAMNVQVSTSDGSDIGVVQNLLGNTEINIGGVILPPQPVCIGSVSDEKNNAIYWFIASGVDFGVKTSMILEYKDNLVSPVLVSNGLITVPYYKIGWANGTVDDFLADDQTGFGAVFSAFSDTLIGNSAFSTVSGTLQGSLLACYNYDGVDIFEGLDIRARLFGNNNGPYTFIYLNKIVPGYLFPNNETEPVIDYITFRDEKTHPSGDIIDFSPETNITAVNILDDFLIWTDGTTEPKKINIERSKAGTAGNAATPTLLINDSNDYGSPLVSTSKTVVHDDITVIKRKPNTPLTVEPTFALDPNKNYAAQFLTAADGSNSDIVHPAASFNFAILNDGDTFVVNLRKDTSDNGDFQIELEVGDEINIQSFNEDASGSQVIPSTPISEPHVTGTVVATSASSPYPNSFVSHQTAGGVIVDCYVSVKIKSIDRSLLLAVDPLLGANFIIERVTPPSSLFSNKFVRFGYRYRYLDKEYSALSPFTTPTFFPGPYDYSSDKGYNLAMVNTINSLKLSGFNNLSTGHDVSSIDILYKDDFSPSVYMAETLIRPTNILQAPSFDPADTVNILLMSAASFSNGFLVFPPGGLGAFARHYNLIDFHQHEEFTISFEITEYDGGSLRFEAFASDGSQTKSYYFKGNKKHSLTFKLDRWNPLAVTPASANSIIFSNSSTPAKFVGKVSNIVLSRGVSDWQNNSIEVKSSGVGALLPTSQLLRAFDSVPTTAQSQEIVGNRVVFGNYKEGMDVKLASGKPYKPRVRVATISGEPQNAAPSIKSLRDYQVGVSFADRFGRESTVLSETKSSKRISISNSPEHTKLDVSITSEEDPVNVELFKFYVKETEDQYYNLALERYYKGKNDAMWLAFSSSDRNKVDKDDYLILKKGVNDIGAVLQDNKYKILDISNEAPIIVKTTVSKVAQELNTDDQLFDGSTSTIPVRGVRDFKLNYGHLHTTAAGSLHKTTVGDGYFTIQFERDGALSKEYEIAKIHCTWDGYNITALADSVYAVSTLDVFGSDVDFILEGPGLTVAENTSIIIRQSEVRGRDDFDGKFFVKVIADGVFQNNINPSLNNPTETPLRVVSTRKVYSWDDNYATSSDFGISDELNATTFSNNVPARRKYFAMTYFTDFWMDDSNGDDIYDYDEQSGYKTYPLNNGAIGPANTTNYWFLQRNSVSFRFPSNSYSATGYIPSQGANKDYNLGFGGLFSNEWQWKSSDDTYFDIPNFFDIINGGNSNHGDQADFASKITPGSRYRWKDDPFQTVHTIRVGVVPQQLGNWITPGPVAGSETGEYHEDKPYDNSFVDNSFATHPARFSKLWSFNNTLPAYWDPNRGSDDFIFNGLEVTLLASGTFVNATAGTFDDVYLEFPGGINGAATNSPNTTADIKVGMAIKQYANQINWSTLMPTHTTQLFVVKKIEGNKVYFSGYRTAFSADDFGSAVSTANANFVFGQPKMNGYTPSVVSNHQNSIGLTGQTQVAAVGYDLEFLDDEPTDDGSDVFSQAVLETEPKVTPEVNLYYEVGQSIPFKLSQSNTVLFCGQKGSVIDTVGNKINYTVNDFRPPNKINIQSLDYTGGAGINDLYDNTDIGASISFTIEDGTVITTTVVGKSAPGVSLPYLEINKNLSKASFVLPWHNCWSYGNGVESNRIKDTYNQPFLSNGVKANVIGDDFLEEKTKKSGLIFSGIYNSSTGSNDLNQFIKAEGITKDLNPEYGSIQKLHTRDSDLIAFCEDKVLRVLANKDALYNADGNPQLTSTNNVLGQAVPYAGEFGISKNPESFASEGFRVYFSDKQRGKVLRLSKDGLTPISDYGMQDWFGDNLRLGDTIKGSYDPKKKEYNITISSDGFLRTVSYNEATDGWVSFKSFYPESGTTIAGDYYTFKSGRLWLHHDNEIRNNFYDGDSMPTTLKAIVSESPEVVKSFTTMNYEGSQSKINELVDYNTTLAGVNTGAFLGGDYFNLNEKKGWFVGSIKTDIETGSIDEFIKKEGKWFNYIRGENILVNSMNMPTQGFDTSSFDVQGVGEITIEPKLGELYGCTDDTTFIKTGWAAEEEFNTSFNYDASAAIDDGSCIPTVAGCTDLAGFNYDPLANTNWGCQYAGCTDVTAFNYDPNANFDDGSCIPVVIGCMDPSQFQGDYYYNVDPTPGQNLNGSYYGPSTIFYNSFSNYNPNANTAGSCIAAILGCTNSSATNYNNGNPLSGDDTVDVNTDDGSCTVPFYACSNMFIDPFGSAFLACNSWFYSDNGNGGINGFSMFAGTGYNQIVDDGSCQYCADPLAANYDGAIQSECDFANQYGNGTIGIDACLYFDCSVISTNMPFATQTTLGPQALSDCGGAGNQPVSHWEMELQVIDFNNYTSDIWNPASPTVQTATHMGPNQPYDDGDFYWTGLNNCTWYMMRMRAAYDNGTTVLYSAWQAGEGVTDCTGPGCTDGTGIGNTVDTDGAGTMGTWAACNYESWASSDDGSCEYTSCSGCMDPDYLEYDGTWLGSDQSECLTLGLYGCTDPLASNHNPTATVNQVSAADTSDPCLPHVYGCIANGITNGYSSNSFVMNNSPWFNQTTPCNDAVGTWNPTTGIYDPAPNNPLLAGEEGYSAFDGGANIGVNTFGDCCEFGDCSTLKNSFITNVTASNMSLQFNAGDELAGASWDVTITYPDGTEITQHVNAAHGISNIPGWYHHQHGASFSWGAAPPQAGDYTFTVDIHPEPISWVVGYQNSNNSVNAAQGVNTSQFYTCGAQSTTITYNPYGCTDINATNYDANAYFNETSATDATDPCNYSGCTETTPRYMGFSSYDANQPGYRFNIAATNFNGNMAITACNNGIENDCCTYATPTVEFRANDGNGKIIPIVNANQMPNYGTGNILIRDQVITMEYYETSAPNTPLTATPALQSSFGVPVGAGGLFQLYQNTHLSVVGTGYATTLSGQSIVITKLELSFGYRHTGAPNSILYPITKTLINPVIGCTDPYSPQYDPLATIQKHPSDCGFIAGCSNVHALNYDPNIANHAGNPDNCFYGDPVPLAGITVSQDTSVTGMPKLIFSQNFDTTTLTHGGVDYSFLQGSHGNAHLFRPVCIYKMPGETEFRRVPASLYALPVQNATLPPTGTVDWIGVWEDQSTGNTWSGKPFIGNNVSMVSNWYTGGTSTYNGEFIPGITIRFQINAVVDYSKTNNPTTSILSEWGRKPLAAEKTPYDSNNPYRKTGGKLRTVWGRENPYGDIDTLNGFVEGQPYIEFTTI